MMSFFLRDQIAFDKFVNGHGANSYVVQDLLSSPPNSYPCILFCLERDIEGYGGYELYFDYCYPSMFD